MTTPSLTLRTLTALVTERLVAVGIPPDEARGEARILISLVTGRSRENLLMYGDAPVTEDEAQRLEMVVERRERREPMAYLLGERWFYGLSFHVTTAVLIPRPETELLVEIALNQLRALDHPRLLDVGTGSGCIAVAVAANRPDSTVVATDLSEEALVVARENAARNGVTVEFLRGDLAAPVSDRRFQAIVSNPPYIAPEEIERLEPEVRDWEPRLALGTTLDPLQIYRRLAQESLPLLNPGGLLAVEVGIGQAPEVSTILQAAGYSGIQVTPDLAGIDRVVSGTRPFS